MLPKIRGLIDRRILLNYRAPPGLVRSLLPPQFKPRLINGFALVGVCMIRFKGLRPALLPPLFGGIGSENAAHRISVEWESDEGLQSGVYVSRRDTNSRLVSFAGGRLFPGVHSRVQFEVQESNTEVSICIRDTLGDLVKLSGINGGQFDSKVFSNHEAASEFFSNDKIGYSFGKRPDKLEGLKLNCFRWQTINLQLNDAFVREFRDWSSDIVLDHALLMHQIEHDWTAVPFRQACC